MERLRGGKERRCDPDHHDHPHLGKFVISRATLGLHHHSATLYAPAPLELHNTSASTAGKTLPFYLMLLPQALRNVFLPSFFFKFKFSIELNPEFKD